MPLQLSISKDPQSHKVLIKYEGFKTCKKGTWEYATDRQDKSANELKPSRDLDMIHSFCKKLFDKHGNVDRDKLLEKYGDASWYRLFESHADTDSNQTDKQHKDDSNQLFKHGNIDYNELIALWMMEGYLGHVDSVGEAYEKGHDIFMDIAYMEIPTLEAPDEEIYNNLEPETTYQRYRRLYATTRLGLVDVFDEGEMPNFGELVLVNGVIRTLRQPKPDWHCSSLLLDGNQLNRQVLGYFTKNLKYFAYFNPRPNLLQLLNTPALNLSVLVLRGCVVLEEINASIGEMTTLNVLEISHSEFIKRIPDSLFSKLTNLRSLNLSFLAIEALPKQGFSKLVDLRRLTLRGCSKLTELPSIKDMTKLEVIDLYGAKSLKKMATTKLVRHQIKILDLSHTSLSRVPCLINSSDSDSTKITHLFLRDCKHIYVFDIVEKIASLQALDLSGAENLMQINTLESLEDLVVLDLSRTSLDSLPESFLQNSMNLSDLNLSGTKISSIPFISHLSNLRRLIVQGCPIKEPPEMKALVNLEVFDISGCTLLENMEKIPFQHLRSLRRLNLSNTNIDNSLVLQVLFLQHLEHLMLAGCSNLTSMPDLKVLTKLELLDVSETKVGNELLFKVPKSLRRLSLSGCSMIKGSFPLASLSLLEELDLQGSNVTEFPYEIAEMAHLKSLRLPHTIDITRVDWSRINCLPIKIIWEQQFEVFNSAEILISGGNKHFMSAKDASDCHSFHLADNEHPWEGYFKEFNFSVSTSKRLNKGPEIYFDGDELVFKGSHSLTAKFPNVKRQGLSVEIHGFSSIPEEAKGALKQAVNVAFVDYNFTGSSSDLHFESMEAVKVCWMSRCKNMKFVIEGKNQSVGVLKSLETLVLSNLVNFEALFAENVPSQCIDSLKNIYIDCCPVLNAIISASHLLENLETLDISFCDVLEAVCDKNAPLCMLPKLRRLNLLELPELRHIGAKLPSLDTLVISHCPQLSHVFSPSMLPETIEVLKIRTCNGLMTLFEPTGSSSLMSPPSLPNLCHVELWNLPKLENMGGDLPSLEKCKIEFCPRLPHNLWPQQKTSHNAAN